MSKPEIDQPDPELAEYQALAEVVLEMRKAQRAHDSLRVDAGRVSAYPRTERAALEAKRLEAACDLRLGQMGYR